MENHGLEKSDIRVLLHNIRSSHNVGSMFRTSDAVGVSRMYLSGFTPTPLDRFKRPIKEIAKTALGAELSIPWEYSQSFEEIISTLKGQGFTIVALEQDPLSVDYKNFHAPQKTLIVVGSEVEGISSELRNNCDKFIEIPMRGSKESLNVAVAFGVALFRLFDK